MDPRRTYTLLGNIARTVKEAKEFSTNQDQIRLLKDIELEIRMAREEILAQAAEFVRDVAKLNA